MALLILILFAVAIWVAVLSAGKGKYGKSDDATALENGMALWSHKAQPVPAPHTTPQLPANDADAEYSGRAAGGAVQVFIRYKDAAGKASARRITLRNVTRKDYGAYITAYCHEREDIRHFRSDRIIELVDTETGEIFDEAMAFLMPLYFCADHFEDTLNKCAAGITLLVALGRSDGEFSIKEKAVISVYIKEVVKDSEVDGLWLERYLSKQRPTSIEIRDAIVDMREWNDDHAREFILAAKALAEIDGIVHEKEKKILDSLYALFNVEWVH